MASLYVCVCVCARRSLITKIRRNKCTEAGDSFFWGNIFFLTERTKMACTCIWKTRTNNHRIEIPWNWFRSSSQSRAAFKFVAQLCLFCFMEMFRVLGSSVVSLRIEIWSRILPQTFSVFHFFLCHDAKFDLDDIATEGVSHSLQNGIFARIDRIKWRKKGIIFPIRSKWFGRSGGWFGAIYVRIEITSPPATASTRNWRREVVASQSQPYKLNAIFGVAARKLFDVRARCSTVVS